MDHIEYVKSNKGGMKIIHNGYMYTVHKNKKCGGIRWRCAQRSLNCKGSISTNLSGTPHLNMPHNHLPDQQSIAIARHKTEDNGNLLAIFGPISLKNDPVLPHVWEPLTTAKGKKMKNKSKHRSNKNNKRLRIRQCSSYEPDFKKAVVLYAEQKSTSEAKRRYGISESNIRRWRRLRNDIMEKASQPTVMRKSKRSKTTFEGSVEDFECSSSLDSMPLEQRLSNKTPTEQEPVLQSQPLSPTKLKVTRQTTKPTQGSQKPLTPEPPNEEVCLRWNSHHSNMQNTFPNLLMREQYVDATLVAEGQMLKCHRLILSSCSPYFEEVLSGISPFQHPVLFMKDIPFWILKSLCDFMYAGEVHIFQNKLEELLAVAETLKIKGLAGKLESGNEDTKTAESVRTVKEDKKLAPERKEEKEMREKKKQPPAKEAEVPASKPKFVRSTHNSKRAAEKEVVKKDEVLDPLDLLEPVYEELTTESKQPSMMTRFRETRSFPIKKSLPKKLKKRKLCDEREESPPMFISRKGTRSRPNVKIPKYYHTHYERTAKLEDALESTIVREPHTDQATDPLMQVEEIKAEPLDLDDDVIEIEDNVVGYSDQEMPLQDEEIFGSYDTPIFNLQNKSDVNKDAEESTFKKINLSQPIIMDVHSVPDKSSDALKIIDVAEIKRPNDGQSSDSLAATLEEKTANDPLHLATETVEQNTGSLTITNIATVAETNTSEKSNKPEDDPVETTIVETNATEESSKPEDVAVVTDGITIANVQSVAEIETAIIETIVKSGHITIEPVENVAVEESSEASNEAMITITNVESVTDINASESNEASSEPTPNLETDLKTVENQPETDNNQTDLCTEDTATEIEQAAGDNGSLENEENTNALGFHIAKVASEQFTMDSDGRYTQNEQSSSKLPPDSAPETVVNNLESIKESQSTESAPDVNNALSDESEILAKSLEALLEK